MNARLGFHDRAWLLCTATCLFWCSPAWLQAESTTDTESRQSDTSADPQSNLKSAIQQELAELYRRNGKQAPDMKRSTGISPKTAGGIASRRISSPSRTKIGDDPASPNKRLSSAAANAGGDRVSPQAEQRSTALRQKSRQTAARIGRSVVTVQSDDNTDGMTEIQRELRELYEKDGKEMPNVDFSELSQRAKQARAQLQQQSAAGTATVTAPDTRRPIRTNQASQQRLGLLQRLNPFRARRGSKNHPNVRRRALRRNQLSGPAQRGGGNPARTAPSAEVQKTESASRPRLLPSFLRLRADRNSVAMPINPQEIVAQPAGSADGSHELTDETSIVDGQLDEDIVAGPHALADDETLAIDDNENASPADEEETAHADIEDFENPFTELSEAEADVASNDDNPFTGLTLDTVEVPAGVDDENADNEELEAAGDKDVTVASSESTHPESDAGAKEEETKIIVDSDVPNPFHEEQGQKKPAKLTSTRLSKLAQIAKRVDKFGLKGFCPVVLRDLRDLVDADPEYASYYESKQYHFSSAEAKARFDAHPELYAPVGGGMDVIVQAASDEDVEGTLDHAVWFRNRLYLFSSSHTMHAFVEQPARYAVDED